MSITKETRKDSYEQISSKRTVRANVILELLEDRKMTVSEIVKELLDEGIIKYYDRNFVAPRLTELKAAGLVEVVGKRTCIMSGKNVAIWRKV